MEQKRLVLPLVAHCPISRSPLSHHCDVYTTDGTGRGRGAGRGRGTGRGTGCGAGGTGRGTGRGAGGGIAPA